MITLIIIFTYFYLKYLRRMIIKFKNRDYKDDDYIEWIEDHGKWIDYFIFGFSMVLCAVSFICLIVFFVKYLP